jgi:ABC-2 type transport system ATP-binding protein
VEMSRFELKHITKNYGKKAALKDVSLTLRPGEIVGLFGENGAGKTTLMKSALGLTRHGGTVTLDGEAITGKNIARLSFATCEHSFFPALTPRDHAEFYKAHFPKFDQKRFDTLLGFFALPEKRAAGSLSTGQKNQFEVLLALSQGADYILMDEPFAGNDVFNREDFYKVLLGILEPHETVLLSTHLIEEVEHFVGRAVLLRQGEIVGDKTLDELEEVGGLMAYVKKTYAYQSDRVRSTIEALTQEEQP